MTTVSYAVLLLCLIALSLLPVCTYGKVHSRKGRNSNDEAEAVSSAWYYGKLLLGLSPIIAIGAFACCHRDNADEEAKRSAEHDHCST